MKGFEINCSDIKAKLENIIADTNAVRRGDFAITTTNSRSVSDALANVTLALRHLEDAQSRIERAIKAVS